MKKNPKNKSEKAVEIKLESEKDAVKAKEAEWIMSVKSFEKNGCMINSN